MGGHDITPPAEHASLDDSSLRKRVCKACDRCRLKKSKCDGATPCSRCKQDNAICVFGERKKSHDKVYPKGYVEMLENQQAQLVAGLQELYRRLLHGEGWNGPPLKDSSRGTPLTHEILEHLGALKHDLYQQSEPFEENLELLQRNLLIKHSGFVQRESSFDTNSESAPSPMFDPVPNHHVTSFTNPWSMKNHFPPTPPLQSPRPSLTKTSSPLKTQMNNTPWLLEPTDYTDPMDLNMTYESPTDFDLQGMMGHNQIFYDSAQMSIHPSMTMMETWQHMDDSMNQYS